MKKGHLFLIIKVFIIIFYLVTFLKTYSALTLKVYLIILYFLCLIWIVSTSIDSIPSLISVTKNTFELYLLISSEKLTN